MVEKLLPWPSDAVMIVAGTAEAANRDEMDSVHPGECRRCHRAIVYDGFTYARAMEIPQRCGRPNMFFRMDCAVLHDPNFDYFEDHRGHKRAECSPIDGGRDG